MNRVATHARRPHRWWPVGRRVVHRATYVDAPGDTRPQPDVVLNQAGAGGPCSNELAATPCATPATAATETILVISDDAQAGPIRQAVAGAGYRAVLADTPDDVAACIRGDTPCLVLLDLAILGKSDHVAASEPSRPAPPRGRSDAAWAGWDDFYERLRRETAAPLIVLGKRQPPAGSPDHDAALDGIAALDLGADDYLTMPLNPLEFAARARAILRRRNASRQYAAPAQHSA